MLLDFLKKKKKPNNKKKTLPTTFLPFQEFQVISKATRKETKRKSVHVLDKEIRKNTLTHALKS